MIVTDYFYATCKRPATGLRSEALARYFLLFDIQQSDAIREARKKETNFAAVAGRAGVFRVNFSLELPAEMPPPKLRPEARKIQDYVRTFESERQQWWEGHPAYNPLEVDPAPEGKTLTAWLQDSLAWCIRNTWRTGKAFVPPREAVKNDAAVFRHIATTLEARKGTKNKPMLSWFIEEILMDNWFAGDAARGRYGGMVFWSVEERLAAINNYLKSIGAKKGITRDMLEKHATRLPRAPKWRRKATDPQYIDFEKRLPLARILAT